MFDKHTFRALLWGLTAFLIIMMIGNRLLPPPPATPPPGTQSPAEGVPPATGVGAPSGRPPSEPGQPQQGGESAAAPVPSHGFAVVDQALAEETVEIGSIPTDGDETGQQNEGDDLYSMRVVLSNVGASVQEVTLPDHLESLDGDEWYKLLEKVEIGNERPLRSLAVEKINIDDKDLILADKKWRVEREDTDEGQTVRFSLGVAKDGEPALRLVRQYTLPRRDEKGLLHDLKVDLTVKNVGQTSHRVIMVYGGGIGIRQIAIRIDGRAVDVGVKQDELVAGQRKTFADIDKVGPGGYEPLYTSDGNPGNRLTWAATANQYFTCTVAPLGRDGTDSPGYIGVVEARPANLTGAAPEVVALSFTTLTERIAPGAVLRYPADVYLGPKSSKSFKQVDRYVARNYFFQISKGYGFCTFVWLVDLMIMLLNGLHFVVRDYGIALIILVLVVRVLLHPITKKGQVNMVRMQKQMGSLGPKMEEIKKKYANDKARQQQETMKLYKDEGVNPMGQMFTCLPMMLQMPIWVALYMSLSNNVLMRHQPFWFTWIRDLTAPDALFSFTPFSLPLFGEITSFNLLPFILGGSMFLQQKLMPKPTPSPTQTKQQKDQAEMMQKMMPMMSIMMLFLFYKAPSGLTLYIMASTIFGTIEQYYIRKHVREQEAAGKFDKKTPREKSPKPRGGFLHKIQKMAEQAQQQQGKRRKPRRT